MSQSTLARYRTRAPRYTSYPTAGCHVEIKRRHHAAAPYVDAVLAEAHLVADRMLSGRTIAQPARHHSTHAAEQNRAVPLRPCSVDEACPEAPGEQPSHHRSEGRHVRSRRRALCTTGVPPHRTRPLCPSQRPTVAGLRARTGRPELPGLHQTDSSRWMPTGSPSPQRAESWFAMWPRHSTSTSKPSQDSAATATRPRLEGAGTTVALTKDTQGE